jgi:hypothetical protein
MLPFIEQIIERYNDHPKCILRNALLPINSNTRYNGYLKEIAAICGINRYLNTHLARHTFADIMLNLGMPLEDVSKMLGYKSIRTTQRYCRVSIARLQKHFNEIVRPSLTLDGLFKTLTGNKTTEQQENLILFNYSHSSGSNSFTYIIKYSS